MVYDYYAQVDRVIDGDSIVLTLDLGYNLIRRDQHARLLDVNTAELRPMAGDQYPDAVRHRNFVVEWLVDAARDYNGDWPLVFDSNALDNFGRALGYVSRRSDGAELNQALIDRFGDAVRY